APDPAPTPDPGGSGGSGGGGGKGGGKGGGGYGWPSKCQWTPGTTMQDMLECQRREREELNNRPGIDARGFGAYSPWG
ncbi:MAG: hypothetical protein WBM08_13890, partial [Prochlorococcaceae cyanobacterium]